MNKLIFVAVFGGAIFTAGIYSAEARPEYAQKEGKKCGYCHLSDGGGGARGFRGIFYGANNLSFDKYEEERESAIAGLDANANAGDTKPKVAYVGSIVGPAIKQVQLAALRAPVLVMYFDSASPEAKTAAKILKKVALGYGRSVSVVGVVEGDADKALALTKDLGSQIRVLHDDGKSMKLFGATQGLDLVAVSKIGETFKLISGFSKANLESAIADIGAFGVAAPQIDIADAPAEVLHGGKLSAN